MAIQTRNQIRCPDDDELRLLARGKLNADRHATIEFHLCECPDCQCRLDEIASNGDQLFSGCIKSLNRPPLPKESAYWTAVSAVEVSITGTHFDSDGDTLPPKDNERNLDFLEPTTTPGRIGKIGPFEVIEEVGRGGMGVVLRAVDASLKREVAVKVLDPGLSQQKVARERFCREAQAAAKVSHDNLVAVYQVSGETDGLPYIVMQLVKGETLENRLKNAGKLSIHETVRIGMQAAAGLASAHAHALIHRDIKPANILIESSTNKVKLTDFGLARAEEDAKLTRTGFVAGTPLYMAPEQARGESVDARSDLFSLGSVLYESLTGRPAFDAKTPLMVLRRLTDEQHEPLHKVAPEVPDWLEDIIDKLLEKDPKDRYQTAEDLEKDLAQHWECIKQDSQDKVEAACPLRPTRTLRGIIRSRSPQKLILSLSLSFLIGLGFGIFGSWFFTPKAFFEPKNSLTQNDRGPKAIAETSRLTGPVWSIASSKDGRTVAAGLEDGSVVFWNPVDGTTSKISPHDGTVWSVSLDPEAKTLFTASDDGKIKKINITNEGITGEIQHDRSIRSSALNTEMTKVISGDRMGFVKVWDFQNTKEPKQIFEHKGVINAVAFANNKPWVASASSNKTAVIWNTEKEAGDGLILRGHDGPVYSIAFSPDDTILATASWDHNVILWNTTTGARITRIKDAHDEGIWGIDFACCGKILATAGQDGIVKVWNIDTLPPDNSDEKAVPIFTFSWHSGTVHSVHFTADGKQLLTGGRDGTIRLWKLKD